MTTKTKDRQRELAAILKRHHKNTKVLAARLLKTIGSSATAIEVTEEMSPKGIVIKVASMLAEKRSIRTEPTAWASKVFGHAGLPFEDVVAQRPQGTVVAEAGRGRRRRVYLQFVQECLQAGESNHRELVDKVLTAFPGLKRTTIDTFVTDLKNPLYTVFKERKVISKEGKLMFENMPPPEQQETGAQATAN